MKNECRIKRNLSVLSGRAGMDRLTIITPCSRPRIQHATMYRDVLGKMAEWAEQARDWMDE
jgi:hypothetical protein